MPDCCRCSISRRWRSRRKWTSGTFRSASASSFMSVVLGSFCWLHNGFSMVWCSYIGPEVGHLSVAHAYRLRSPPTMSAAQQCREILVKVISISFKGFRRQKEVYASARKGAYDGFPLIFVEPSESWKPRRTPTQMRIAFRLSLGGDAAYDRLVLFEKYSEQFSHAAISKTPLEWHSSGLWSQLVAARLLNPV